jgi:5'-nucleotidase
MRVAVVNDDGIHASGLHALAKALDGAGHAVTIVAPHAQQSGSGTSVGSELDGRTVAMVPVALDGLDVPAYAVEATPALIALAISHGLLGRERPDVVVSGINSGHNVGRLTVFSGTLSVALVCASYGLPAVALSCAAGDRDRYPLAAAFLAGVLEELMASLPDRVAYNINYPTRQVAEARGVRLARLHAPQRPDVRIAHRDGLLQVALADRQGRDDPASDIALLEQGFISLTPVEAGFRDDCVTATTQDTLDALWPGLTAG